MCYFDQTRWNCGYWRWGSFRQQCNYEHRTGETCGMKLVYGTSYEKEDCTLCGQMKTKAGRIEKLHENIIRWREQLQEGVPRTASIEKATSDIQSIEKQIEKLNKQHSDKERNL